MNLDNSEELFVPIALRFHIERALWQALIRTHPNPKAFHDAWLLQLPGLMEHAEKLGGQSLGTTESDLRSAIDAVSAELSLGVAQQKVQAACDEAV